MSLCPQVGLEHNNSAVMVGNLVTPIIQETGGIFLLILMVVYLEQQTVTSVTVMLQRTS